MIDLRAIRFVFCIFMALLCIWAGFISANAAIYWRAQGDPRQGLCWMLVVLCVLGILMFGHAADRRQSYN